MANDTFSFSSPDDQETAVLQPVATDGLFAAADSGTATPQQSDNGTNNHADNTAYVGEHVMASTTAKSHGKAARIAIITIFAVLLAALIAYFFVGRWYFQDKAAPGVHLGNVSVMGQTREELANTVKQRLNNTTVTFTAEGNSVKASLKDLGVTVDTDKTVDALLNAKTGDVAKLNIFDQPHIALTATTDKETAEQFVTAGLVDEADRAQIATVVYNKSTKQFDYTAGQDARARIPMLSMLQSRRPSRPRAKMRRCRSSYRPQRIRLMTRAHSKHSLTPMPGLASN